MENKLPEKYENNFFRKIKILFTNVFRNNKVTAEDKTVQDNGVEIKSVEFEFPKTKTLSNKARVKKDILGLIEKDPELINTLSLERLRELNSMYDEIIEENNRKINKLKRKIGCRI